MQGACQALQALCREGTQRARSQARARVCSVAGANVQVEAGKGWEGEDCVEEVGLHSAGRDDLLVLTTAFPRHALR